jgi:hypothetical protein
MALLMGFKRMTNRAIGAGPGLLGDNPPYTTPGMKERVLAELARLGKPFALLLPATVLHSQFLRDTLDVIKHLLAPMAAYMADQHKG